MVLRKPELKGFENEPDVRERYQWTGLIGHFSGDKLLGGPQAGLIAGRWGLSLHFPVPL
jgi:seryl-tRNA(Sec) selenium transferase